MIATNTTWASGGTKVFTWPKKMANTNYFVSAIATYTDTDGNGYDSGQLGCTTKTVSNATFRTGYFNGTKFGAYVMGIGLSA